MIGFFKFKSKVSEFKRQQRLRNWLFLVQIIFVALQTGFVVVMANLIVQISRIVGGALFKKKPIAPQSIDFVPFFGHGEHNNGVVSYVVTAILLLSLISLTVVGMAVLLQPRRPRYIRLGILGSGLGHIIGLLTAVVWTVLFAVSHQYNFLISNTAILVGFNGFSFLIICVYWRLNQRLGRLKQQNKPKPTPSVFIPPLANKPFFEPGLMDNLSFKQRLFYVRNCKNRMIFSLDRHWLLIFKIYFPQILLSLMWASYELVSRVLIIRFAVPHYHHHSPTVIIASLNLAMRYSNSIYGFLFVIVSFVTAPLQVLFARAVAQQDRTAAEKVVSFALFLSLILLLFFLPVGIGFVNFWIKMQNPSIDKFTFQMTRRLVCVTFGLLPIFFIFFIWFDLLTCEGRFRLFLICSFLQVGLQIFLIWVLAAFSNLKILAAPVGDMIAYSLIALVLLIINGRDSTSWIKFRWRWIRPYPEQTIAFCKIGFSIMIKIMTIIFAQIYYVRLIGFAPVKDRDFRGNINIVMQFTATFGIFTFLVRTFFIGVAVANRQVLSYCYSRRLWYRMRKIAIKVLILDMIWWLICSALAWTLGTQFLHLLNPDLPSHSSNIRLFLGLTVLGIVNRCLISELATFLQAAGYNNAVIAIYIVNLFLGVILFMNCLWAVTWATFSLTHSQFILFLYSLARLLLAVVIAMFCWCKFKPFWYTMKQAKATDDALYSHEIKTFKHLLYNRFNNNIKLMAKSWKH